ncbi:hypothetical protein R5W23_005118 [Gemmata sp. JC673]|uniref:Uncharacterized protein n=1 Tax=Gemmata algarum TaxID=2975278 RepID=A0ABU5F848_9BACT|nr:hypothetical protein [Gemmata algarum]MDY3563506.1 hypothetical protein [Gemmata algarum]
MSFMFGEEANVPMVRVASFDEQWGDRIGRMARRYRVRIRPTPAGSWGLRPRTYEFAPCLVFWGMVGVPDEGVEGGVGHWTLWFAFREPPYLHRDRESHDAEAIFVNDAEGPHGLMAPGSRFRLTANEDEPVAEVEVLGVVTDAEPGAAPDPSA